MTDDEFRHYIEAHPRWGTHRVLKALNSRLRGVLDVGAYCAANDFEPTPLDVNLYQPTGADNQPITVPYPGTTPGRYTSVELSVLHGSVEALTQEEIDASL